jgi:hypothetical protein
MQVPGASVADPKQKFRILFRIWIRPEVSFGSGSDFGSGFGSGSRSQTGQIFLVLKFLRSLIFKDALHQLCDLATNSAQKIGDL